MAKHANVYDAMLAGFVKLILVIAIGALTLSKFAGFEWLRIQQHHLEPLMTVTSPQMCLQSLTDMATESNYWLGFLVFLYLFCGIIRMPGQMVLHTLLGFALGFKTAFPIALAANTVTSCALFYLGMLYARGGSGEAWQYYAAKIDVFLLKISQARFGIYVDDLGQYYDKGKQAEMAKDKNYRKKVSKEGVKPEEDDWSEWQQWSTPRFMHLLWSRVFPLSEHWVMNMGGGLVNGKGMIFSEFFLAVVIGSIPYLVVITKFGELMKFYFIEEMLTWTYVKWPLLCFLGVLPPIINYSGCLQQAMGQGEYGWTRTPGQGYDPAEYGEDTKDE